VLAEVRLRPVGAGRDAGQARQPAMVNVEENRIEGNRRVPVFSWGMACNCRRLPRRRPPRQLPEAGKRRLRRHDRPPGPGTHRRLR
jgi:hypothetical protein